jgi:capsular exopolysaccharide synthesis family protein
MEVWRQSRPAKEQQNDVDSAFDPALPPTRRWALAATCATAGGLLLGVVLALLADVNTIRSPRDVSFLPFLGIVPHVPSTLQKRRSGPFREAFRIVHANLCFSCTTANATVLVTSEGMGQGKTTVTEGLAYAAAAAGRSTLVVDADLRRPQLHTRFTCPIAPGLTDLIVDKVDASKAIRASRTRGLMVLPSGRPPSNPAELLASERMANVLSALRAHYDLVILDSPPALRLADVIWLAPKVDGALLVVGIGRQGSLPFLHRTVEAIGSVGGKLLGFVLNEGPDNPHPASAAKDYYGDGYGAR